MDNNIQREEYQFGRAFSYNHEGKHRADKMAKEIEIYQEYMKERRKIDHEAEKKNIPMSERKYPSFPKELSEHHQQAYFDGWNVSYCALDGERREDYNRNPWPIKLHDKKMFMNNLQRLASSRDVNGVYVAHKLGFMADDSGYYFVCGLSDDIMDPNKRISITKLMRRQKANVECIFLDAMAFKITGEPEMVTLHNIYEYINAISLIKNADKSYLENIKNGKYPNILDYFYMNLLSENWAIYSSMDYSDNVRKAAKNTMDSIVDGTFYKKNQNPLTLKGKPQCILAEEFKKIVPNYYTVYENFESKNDYELVKNKFIEKMKEFPEIHYAFDESDFREMTESERRHINWSLDRYHNPYVGKDFSYFIFKIHYEDMFTNEILYALNYAKYHNEDFSSIKDVTSELGFMSVEIPLNAVEQFVSYMTCKTNPLECFDLGVYWKATFCLDNGLIRENKKPHIIPFLVHVKDAYALQQFCEYYPLKQFMEFTSVKGQDELLCHTWNNPGWADIYDKEIKKAIGKALDEKHEYIDTASFLIHDTDIEKTYISKQEYDEITEEDIYKLHELRGKDVESKDFRWLKSIGMYYKEQREEFYNSWDYKDWLKKNNL